MGKAQQVTIGSATFPSSTAARRFFSAMLNAYKLYERVSEEDQAILTGLLDRHPERGGKLAGRSISHFEVHPFEHGSRCFFLVRDDGTKVHFSFMKCI